MLPLLPAYSCTSHGPLAPPNASTRSATVRRCLPSSSTQVTPSPSNSPVEFPPDYIPPGTKRWAEQRGLSPSPMSSFEEQQQQHQQHPFVASSSSRRQRRLLESLQERQRAAQRRAAISGASAQTSGSNAADSAAAAAAGGGGGPLQTHSLPASSSTADSAAGSRSRRQGSLSDSELDAVAAGSLQSWFASAPPAGPPKGLEPGVLDHKDPHVVSRAITDLVEAKQLDEAVKAVTHVVAKNRTDALRVLQHKPFMQQAKELKASRAVLNLMRVLPPNFCFVKSFTLALDVCAEARDLATGTALFDMASKTLPVVGRKPDLKMMTTYIKVCKSAGNADKAYSVFLSMKRGRMPLDAHVYSVLIAAFGEAMHRELTVAHERKDQYVLLERAYGILMEAQNSGIKLNEVPWNAVLTCAGRCGQLKRGFEVLDLMQLYGVEADVVSLGSIVEACVLAGNGDLALKMFNRVLAEGSEKSVELYTQAVSACKLGGQVDLDMALRIYAHMQHNNVQPDKKFFAALIATAGAAGRLDLAFDILSDVQAEGILPSSTVCSGLILACIKDRRFHLAQKVYDLCAEKGIFPALSLFNNLMDWYAGELRLGDVVRLLTDMTQRARLQPNMNTYRILLNACQRTDQGALAFEVYEVMRAKRLPILQERIAQSLYYLLLKCCYNQQRRIWAELLSHEHNSQAPWHASLSAGQNVNLAEADQMLRALGSSAHARGARSLLLKENDVSTWANCAVSAYRDMAARGWKPNYDVINMLLNCMRMPLRSRMPADRMETEDDQLIRAAGQGLPSSQEASELGVDSPDLVRTQTARGAGMRGAFRRYDQALDSRAVALVEDAIAHYALPRFTVDKDCVVDLRSMPPALAEGYVMAIFAAWEKRAARARTMAGTDPSAAGSSSMFFHRMRLLVPPFPIQSVNWPSYLPRMKDPSLSSIDDDPLLSWKGPMLSGDLDSDSDDVPPPTLDASLRARIRRQHLLEQQQEEQQQQQQQQEQRLLQSQAAGNGSISAQPAANGATSVQAAASTSAHVVDGTAEHGSSNSSSSSSGSVDEHTLSSQHQQHQVSQQQLDQAMQQLQELEQATQQLTSEIGNDAEETITFTAADLAAPSPVAPGSQQRTHSNNTAHTLHTSAHTHDSSSTTTTNTTTSTSNNTSSTSSKEGVHHTAQAARVQDGGVLPANGGAGDGAQSSSVGDAAESAQAQQQQQQQQRQQREYEQEHFPQGVPLEAMQEDGSSSERVTDTSRSERDGSSSELNSSGGMWGSVDGWFARQQQQQQQQQQHEQPSTSYAALGGQHDEGAASTPRSRSPGSRHRFPKHASHPNNSKTGAAVAATCLRMKVFANFNAREGIIDLTPPEIVKWVRARHIWQLRMRGMLGVSGAPQGAVAQSSMAPSRDQSPSALVAEDDSEAASMRRRSSPPRVGTSSGSIPGARPFGAQRTSQTPMRGSTISGLDRGSNRGGGSSDSDEDRNDFGAWSPLPRGGMGASRLQQQQRDIRLGLGPQVQRPPVRGTEVMKDESSSSS